MGIVEQFLLPPTAQHFGLLPYLIFLMLLLHLPFLALLMGGSAVSLVARRYDSKLAQKFMDLAGRHGLAWIIFGVVPAVTLVFLFGQYLYGASVPITQYLERVFLGILLALSLLYVYARTRRLLAGVAGHLVLVASIFFFTSVMDLVANPGRWMLTDAVLPHVFSIQVVVHFAIFSLLAVVLTGAVSLFLNFVWPDSRIGQEDPLHKPLRYVGAGLTLAGALALPVHLLWDFATAPDTALSTAAFVAGAAAVLLLFPVACMALYQLTRSRSGLATPALLLVMVVFGLLLFKGLNLQSTANAEHLFLLAQQARKGRDALVLEQGKKYAKAEPDVALGKLLFDQRCTACHKWDAKLVGPPYLEVLPKYAADPDKLSTFVLNPVKIDDDYPPMPSQGLRPVEAASVGMYLLQELEARTRGGESK